MQNSSQKSKSGVFLLLSYNNVSKNFIFRDKETNLNFIMEILVLKINRIRRERGREGKGREENEEKERG